MYQACIKLQRFQHFQGFRRHKESITYVFSTSGERSNPTLSANLILYSPERSSKQQGGRLKVAVIRHGM